MYHINSSFYHHLRAFKIKKKNERKNPIKIPLSTNKSYIHKKSI